MHKKRKQPQEVNPVMIKKKKPKDGIHYDGAGWALYLSGEKVYWNKAKYMALQAYAIAKTNNKESK